MFIEPALIYFLDLMVSVLINMIYSLNVSRLTSVLVKYPLSDLSNLSFKYSGRFAYSVQSTITL